MTTLFTRFVAAALALTALSLTSCKKDEVITTAQLNGAPTLAASNLAPDLSLTTANVGTTASKFTYTAANFGYQALVTYTLQFDKKGGNFKTPVTFSAGTSAGSLNLTTGQLVSVYTNLGLPYGTSSQIDARLVASIGANTQQVSSVVTLTGNPNPVCIPDLTGLTWGIVGPAADGWPGATNTDRVMTYDCYTQTFKIRTTLTADKFKFRANKDWTTNLGGTGTSFTAGVPLTLNGGDLTATAGTYDITLTVTTDPTGKTVTGGTVTIK